MPSITKTQASRDMPVPPGGGTRSPQKPDVPACLTSIKIGGAGRPTFCTASSEVEDCAEATPLEHACALLSSSFGLAPLRSARLKSSFFPGDWLNSRGTGMLTAAKSGGTSQSLTGHRSARQERDPERRTQNALLESDPAYPTKQRRPARSPVRRGRPGARSIIY